METFRDFWRNQHSFFDFFQNKRNLASLLVLAFLAISLPLGLYLIKQQQTFRSNASGELIQLIEGPCIQTINNKKTAICNSISLKLFNPFAIASGSAVPSPTASSTASASPAQSPSPSPSAVASVSPQIVRVSGNTDVQIQAALDQVKTSGGAVYIPAGTYTINKKIRVFSNVTLFGDGIDQTILDATSSIGDGTPAMGNDSNAGQKNITIRDMTIKGYWDGTGNVLKIENLDQGFIYRVKMERAKYGLLLGFHDGKGVTNVRVSECQVSNTRTQAIFMSLGENNVIDHCAVDSGGSDSLGIGLEIGAEGKISNNQIISNSVSNGGHSYSFTAGNDTQYDPSWINSNNIVCYNTAQGNHIQPIWDQRGTNNVYVGNSVGVNNVSSFGYEEKSGTDPRCDIPAKFTIPAAPTKPAASLISEPTIANHSVWNILPNFEVKAQTASMSATPSASVAPSGTSYRLAETQAGLAQANWISYTTSPIVTNFTVSTTYGVKQIWVEFRSASGQTLTDHLESFELLAPSPLISGVNCTLDLTNKNLKIEITGSNLGTQKGVLTANGTALDTASWDNTTIVGLLTTSAIQTGQKYSVIVRRADSLQSTAQSCQINTSAISLGARVFCRAEGQFDVSNVKVTIAPLETPEKIVEETVTIDKDGILQGIKTKLQTGKQYIISAKGPNTLRRNTVVTGQEGTAVANTTDGKPFILPIGDIAPTTPDGQINGLDRAELVKQWRILNSSASGTLSGDFNRDKKVNSIDWACMKYDFNSKDDLPGSTGSSYTNGANFNTGQSSVIFTY